MMAHHLLELTFGSRIFQIDHVPKKSMDMLKEFLMTSLLSSLMEKNVESNYIFTVNYKIIANAQYTCKIYLSERQLTNHTITCKLTLETGSMYPCHLKLLQRQNLWRRRYVHIINCTKRRQNPLKRRICRRNCFQQGLIFAVYDQKNSGNYIWYIKSKLHIITPMHINLYSVSGFERSDDHM